eukprot:g42726.t1
MFSERAALKEPTLLSAPLPAQPGPTFPRVTAGSYENRSGSFRLGERSFQRQYAHIYAVRLVQMRPMVEERARKKWGADVPVKKLCELQMGEKCCAVGTLFKHMELKPSILREISEERVARVWNELPEGSVEA